jgi:hypothetical protein
METIPLGPNLDDKRRFGGSEAHCDKQADT